MKFLPIVFFIVMFFCSCSKTASSDVVEDVFAQGSVAKDDRGADAISGRSKYVSHKRVGGAGYTIRIVSALDFLKGKGEEVESVDREALENELVVLLEIESPDPGKDFFASSRSAFSKEDGLQYLVGEISRDLTLVQGKQEFYPSGVNYEQSFGQAHKINVLFFFNGVDKNKSMELKYYDRLLDGGMIHFKINN